MPQRKGEMLSPCTGSWLIAMISRFVRMSTVAWSTADSCNGTLSLGRCSKAREMWAYVGADEERRLHERPGGEVRLGFFVREPAVATGSSGQCYRSSEIGCFRYIWS